MNARDVTDEIDDRIRAALAARADLITAEAAPPAGVAAFPPSRPAPAEEVFNAGRRRWAAPLLAAAAVVALAVGTTAAITALRPHGSSPAHPTPLTTPAAPHSVAPSQGVRTTPAPRSAPPSTRPPSTSGRPAPSGSATGAPATGGAAPAGFALGYQPLWPFSDFAAAEAWRLDSSGHQPWHLDAGQTALAFTDGYLGFTDLTLVTSTSTDSDGAHVGIGYRNPNGATTAAVLHLVRFGTSASSPWEVVGSDDTTFSLERPSYGSQVSTPMTVGGHMTGVDESITVTVRALDGVRGRACCLPAGGSHTPWQQQVSFTGSGVLTIVASTGGHLLGVERFAIQGVQAG
jgi:hypothetical protein